MFEGERQYNEYRINPQYVSHSVVDYVKDEAPPIDKYTKTIRPRKILTTETFFRRFSKVFSDDNDLDNEIIPVNCRLIKKIAGYTFIVIEQPPVIRNILVTSIDPKIMSSKYTTNTIFKDIVPEDWFAKNKTAPYKFTLAMPFVLFMFRFNQNGYLDATQVFFRTAPLRNINDYLLIPPLNNLGSDLTVCIGSSNDYGRKDLTLSKSQLCDNFISTFWSAPFNTDYSHNVHKYSKSTTFSDYFLWQYHSLKDPLFIFKADWIQAEALTLNNHFHHLFQDQTGYRDEAHFRFEQFQKIFTSSHKFKIERDQTTGQDRVYHEGHFDSAHLNGLNVHLGDNVVLRNGKLAILENIVAPGGSPNPSELHYVCENKILKFKVTPRNIKILKDAYRNVKTIQEYKTPSGKVLKAGDLIKTPAPPDTMFNDQFILIENFRRNLMGDIEVNLPGMGHFLIDSLDLANKEVVDATNFTINGLHLIKDQAYNYASRQNLKVINNTRRIIYKSIEMSGSGHLTAKFELSPDEPTNISLNDLKAKVLPATDEAKRNIGNIFRIGNCLRSSNTDKVSVYANQIDINSLRDYDYHRFSINSPLLPVGKDTFTIEANDVDITYTVGERYLVVDNENPLEMMNIKILKEFKYEKEDHSLQLIMEDKFNNITSHALIRDRFIYPEKFRRITNKLGDLEVGMKIVANEAYIYLFPKKDTNIIVAFVVDSIPEPLVFLSNGMTLWLSDVQNKFKHIKMSSKLWKKHEHTPVVNEIKLQAGDIITQADPTVPEYVHVHYNARSLNSYPSEDYSTTGGYYPWALYTKKYFRGSRSCRLLSLPTPRYSSSITDITIPLGFGFPTPFGVLPTQNSGFRYPVINNRLGG